MPDARAHPFDHLTPQALLDALDAQGLRGDGRVLQLNSYENRVFQFYLEDGTAAVAKFYRPGRWSDAQILEEHAFALELAEAELPVIAPRVFSGGSGGGGTLARAEIDGQEFRFAVYSNRSGHGPELDDPATLLWLGRFIARMHSVGARRPFEVRRALNPLTYGHAARHRLLALDLISAGERAAWHSACAAALAAVESAFAKVAPMQLRLHGDCHPGNILWREEGPHVVDLDDACMGPAVQDVWMLLPGGRAAMAHQLSTVLTGYAQFRIFDHRELNLIEPLRTLRMIHHCAWLAERWDDPAFPVAFPWFGTPGYWAEQTSQLHQQLDAMAEPPLELSPLD